MASIQNSPTPKIQLSSTTTEITALNSTKFSSTSILDRSTHQTIFTEISTENDRQTSSPIYSSLETTKVKTSTLQDKTSRSTVQHSSIVENATNSSSGTHSVTSNTVTYTVTSDTVTNSKTDNAVNITTLNIAFYQVYS